MDMKWGNGPLAAGMRRASLALAIVLGAFSAFGLSSVPAASGRSDEVFLQRLAGSWKGRGRLRPEVTAKVEPVACRLNATWNGGDRSLQMRMNCRGLDVTFTTTGILRTSQGSNIVQGNWRGPKGGADVSGRRVGNALRLTMMSRDADTGRLVRSTLHLRLSGNGQMLSNSVHTQDGETGKTFRVLSLSMKK